MAIAVWVVCAFIQSLLLLVRAGREGLELRSRQWILLLWAVEVFCCFVTFLWSFQDRPDPTTDSLYKHEAPLTEMR